MSNQILFNVFGKNGQPVFITHFERQQKADSFEGIVPTVDIVPQKQVIGVGNLPTYFKELHQIIELPMHIPAQEHRRAHIHHVGFVSEDLLGFVAEELHLGFVEDFACEKPLNKLVKAANLGAT